MPTPPDPVPDLDCSNAALGGRFVLRACIVNFRTEAEHVERLLDAAAELGAELDARRGSCGSPRG